jgi:hypothetical protein
VTTGAVALLDDSDGGERRARLALFGLFVETRIR